MPVLRVTLSRERYAALRRQAKANQRSISCEVRALLKQWVPTNRERKARDKLFGKILKLRAQRPRSRGPFPSAEEMVREDRER